WRGVRPRSHSVAPSPTAGRDRRRWPVHERGLRMFSLAGSDIPIRVQSQMRHDEAPITTLLGLRESGFMLTDRRLFAWRENGAGAPLPLPAIERILIDEDGASTYHHVVVLP